MAHDNYGFQLGLTREKLVEEATEPDYGQERQRRSSRWWWTRVLRSGLRHASKNIIVTKLLLIRHHFLPHWQQLGMSRWKG